MTEGTRPEWGAARRLVWVDVETTGLEPEHGSVLEVAVAVTTAPPAMKLLGATSVLVKPAAGFRPGTGISANEVPDFHLGDGGLLDCAWHNGRSPEDAATWLDGWLSGRVPPDEYGPGPMCGSSVAFDRAWIDFHLHDLSGWWTYRNLDVSAIREWMTYLCAGPGLSTTLELAKSEGKAFGPEHRALPDIMRTIHVLRALTNFAGGMKGTP